MGLWIGGFAAVCPEGLEHPKAIKQKNRKRDQDYGPWIDLDTWFTIVRFGLEMLEEKYDDVCDMLGQQELSECDE